MAAPQGRSDTGDRELEPNSLPEPLVRGFQDLGLSPYESRVLLALLQRGSANSVELSKRSGVPRTAVYPVLQGLGMRGMADRVAGPGPAVWASPGRDQVMQRLKAAEEERLRQHRDRADGVRQLLDRTFPEEPPDVALPFVHILPGARQMKGTYEELLRSADSEVMMFTRAPYTWSFPNPNHAVLEMLERDVDVRVLYEAREWDDLSAEPFRAEMAVYHAAGVKARLVEHLALKLVIVDRSVALVNMLHPVAVDGYPTTLHIEHPGFAGLAATAFDQLWDDAQPLREPRLDDGAVDGAVDGALEALDGDPAPVEGDTVARRRLRRTTD